MYSHQTTCAIFTVTGYSSVPSFHTRVQRVCSPKARGRPLFYQRDDPRFAGCKFLSVTLGYDSVENYLIIPTPSHQHQRQIKGGQVDANCCRLHPLAIDGGAVSHRCRAGAASQRVGLNWTLGLTCNDEYYWLSCNMQRWVLLAKL